MSFSIEGKSDQELLQIITSAFQNCALPDPIKRKQGEQTLSALSNTPSYPVWLLHLIANQIHFDLALRASIELKKWCEKYEKLQEYDTACLQEVTETTKANLVQTMLSANYKIALQVSEAIYLLSRKEFPEKWKPLAKNLAGCLKGENEMFEKELVCLKTLLKIFKKYEYSERSDPLYEEIILVCDDTHDIFLGYVSMLVGKLQAAKDKSKTNSDNLKLLKTCLKIFYCLNFQDLHPNFENNLNYWMNLLAQVLKLENSKNLFDDDVLLFKCKGEAMRSILLYATKYREEFEGLINEFSNEIWNICSTTTEDNKYDKIILNALKYFKSLILWPSLSAYFSSNLSMLINTLIIPNLKVSKKDQILFKEEAENFIDIYFNNNGELSSRRSVTVELMKSLSKYYKDGVNQILEASSGGYIQSLQTGQKNLETELTIVNLLCDGASVCFRAKDGVTETTVSPQLIKYIFDNMISGYFYEIFQDLFNKKINVIEEKYNLLHLTYLLRYVFYFRIYLDKSILMELAKMISFFLSTKSETMISIVFYTIEALIDVKEGDFKFLSVMKNYFNKTNVQPQITEILENIARIGQSDEINNYQLKVMLVIIRTLAESTEEYIVPFAGLYQKEMDKMIKGYTFQSSFLIFESVGTLIYYACQANQNSLQTIENYIVPHLNNVFTKNLSDLLGFVLQIYSLIVQSSPANLLKEAYSTIYLSILDLKNWVTDNSSLFPAYALYLQTYLAKFPQKAFETASELQKIMLYLLGNQQENLFFNISRAVFQILDWNSLVSSGWFGFVFQSIFNFYNQLKTAQMASFDPTGNKKQEIARPMFIKELFIFIAECLIKFEPQSFVVQCEQASGGFFKPFFENEVAVLKTSQRRGRDRKILFVGLINLLFIAFNNIGLDLWSLLLAELVQNISNRRNVRARFRADLQGTPLTENVVLGTNSGFQKLSFLKENKVDISGICDDEEKYFALKFNEFYSNPQIKNAINIGNILTVQQQELLLKVLQE